MISLWILQHDCCIRLQLQGSLWSDCIWTELRLKYHLSKLPQIWEVKAHQTRFAKLIVAVVSWMSHKWHLVNFHFYSNLLTLWWFICFHEWLLFGGYAFSVVRPIFWLKGSHMHRVSGSEEIVNWQNCIELINILYVASWTPSLKRRVRDASIIFGYPPKERSLKKDRSSTPLKF